jgi:hypothetical protein
VLFFRRGIPDSAQKKPAVASLRVSRCLQTAQEDHKATLLHVPKAALRADKEMLFASALPRL